jgi:hypothetical protein
MFVAEAGTTRFRWRATNDGKSPKPSTCILIALSLVAVRGKLRYKSHRVACMFVCVCVSLALFGSGVNSVYIYYIAYTARVRNNCRYRTFFRERVRLIFERLNWKSIFILQLIWKGLRWRPILAQWLVRRS